MQDKPLRIERRHHMRVGARGMAIVRGCGSEIHGRDYSSAPGQRLIAALASGPEQLAAPPAQPEASVIDDPIEVMIVDSELGERAQLAAVFRDQGCHVIEVGSPAEVLASLEDASRMTNVIAVADTIPASAAIDLCDFLDDDQAQALVIALGGAEWIPGRMRIDPSNTDGLLASRVRSVLRKASRA